MLARGCLLRLNTKQLSMPQLMSLLVWIFRIESLSASLNRLNLDLLVHLILIRVIRIFGLQYTVGGLLLVLILLLQILKLVS